MKIRDFISRMTLEEKAGLCSGLNFWETKPLEHHGLPSIMMTDGPHGLRKVTPESDGRGSEPATCFPPAVLSACSFDRELLRELGEAIGDEAQASGVRIVLGPGVNIKRSPLCGRNFEYFSEDPYLAGEMAASFIKGVQSRGIGTSLKHYAANNQETRRWSVDAQIDERTLREIYLPAFKKAVEAAKPATVMCSYNRLNGEYVSESRKILTDILRGEWGFEGIVISDWGAVNDRVLGLEAGLDLEMPGAAVPSNDLRIIEAVRSGRLDEAVLDLAVERIITTVCRFGGDKAVSKRFKCSEVRSETTPVTALDVDAHDALAKKIAQESMVLLKNERGILPLDKALSIAFIGEMAKNPRFQGAGSSQVNATKITSAYEVASKIPGVLPGENVKITYSRGYKINDCDDVNDALQFEATLTAEAADICVVFVGLPPHYESEGYDRTHMRLPEGQNKLVQAVAQANPNTVVVLSNGSPVEMPWHQSVPAILEAYIGGQASGAAVVDILFGAANPCGKLAETFPYKLSDNPSYLNFPGEYDTVQYREGVFVGYRYYDTKEMNVLYPFGYGLSYTTFKYSNINLSTHKMKDTDTLKVTADIENTGTMPGKEIVQLYVGPGQKDDRLIRPDKELRDFVKVHLNPGQKKQVTFKLDKSAFSYYNTQLGDFHVLTGDYVIMLAKSSRDIPLSAQVHVTSTVRIPFKAHPNTTVRDIRRMEHGKAFLSDIAARYPKAYGFMDRETAPVDDKDYGYIMSAPEFVFRQSRLMGTMPGVTDEDIQKWMDEKLNR